MNEKMKLKVIKREYVGYRVTKNFPQEYLMQKAKAQVEVRSRLKGEAMKYDINNPPAHPYWCDDCAGKAPFSIMGCPIKHEEGCVRENKDAMEVYEKAKAWCLATKGTIK